MPHVFTLEGADVGNLGPFPQEHDATLGQPVQIWSTEAESSLARRLRRLPFVHQPAPGLGDSREVVVNYIYGSPLGPHGAPIGPARLPTLVYDYDELLRRAQAREHNEREKEIRRWINKRYEAATIGLGDMTEFLRRQNPVLASLLVLGTSMLVSLAVGGAVVWALKRTGYRSE